MLAVTEIPLDVQIAVWSVLTSAIGFGFILDLKVAQRITKLEVKMDMTLSLASKKLAGFLHSPHTPELDSFIEAFQENRLAETNVDRFLQLLHEKENDLSIEKGERAIAWATSVAVCRAFNRPIPAFDSELIKRNK